MIESVIRICRDYQEAKESMRLAAVRTVLHPFLQGMARLASLGKERELRVDLTAVPEEVKASTTPVSIVQGILAEAPGKGVSVRVRRTDRGEGSEPEYTMTAKSYSTFDEAETEISKEIFEGFLPLLSRREEKLRYCWQGWDIDEITVGERSGRVVAEYELPEGEDQAEMPPQLVRVRAGGQVDG